MLSGDRLNRKHAEEPPQEVHWEQGPQQESSEDKLNRLEPSSLDYFWGICGARDAAAEEATTATEREQKS